MFRFHNDPSVSALLARDSESAVDGEESAQAGLFQEKTLWLENLNRRNEQKLIFAAVASGLTWISAVDPADLAEFI